MWHLPATRLIAPFVLTLCFQCAAVASEKIGIVLLHGKSGTSQPGSPVGGLMAVLREAGMLVSAPNMAWSRSRYIDKDYEAALAEIDFSVEQLRKAGASKIVVAGHSMGANAAIGYAARREGLAGVIALAPGHLPEDQGFQNKVKHDHRRAKAMVNAGDGEIVHEFLDVNQGKVSRVKMKARIYFSWFDPNGLAVMPMNVANLKSGTPLLWIVGKKDKMSDRGAPYAFSGAPKNPRNLYLEVSGGHKATPKVAAHQIIQWLKGN